MFKKLHKLFVSLIAIFAIGLTGSMAQAADEDVVEPDVDVDVEVEVDVDVEPEEPELIPPEVLVPDVDRPLGLNPMVSAEPFGRLNIDMNLHLSDVTDDLTAFITSPVLQARIPVGMLGVDNGNALLAGLEIGADLPLLWVAPWNDPLDQLDSAVGVGNPYLSAHFVQALERTAYSIGLGIAIPLASTDGTRGEARALGYDYAIGNRIGHDMYLWAPDRLSFVIPARIETIADRVVLGADVAFAAMLWTGPGAEDTDYVTQMGAEIGYRVTPTSTLGLRALGHWAPTLDEYDFAFALEPGFRTQLGAGGSFMGIRLTMPINEPYGFAFDQGNNYALSVSFGTDFR